MISPLAMMSMTMMGADPADVKARPTKEYLELHKEMKAKADGKNPTLQQATDFLDGLKFDTEVAAIQMNAKEVARLQKQVDTAQVLVDFFKHFAKQDKDPDTLSAADIKAVAGIDGNAKDITPKDLK